MAKLVPTINAGEPINSSELNICYCLDKHYITPFIVSLTSLITNLKIGAKLKVFVIYDEIDENTISKIVHNFSKPNINIQFIDVGIYKYCLDIENPQVYNKLTSHFNQSLFLRIYIPYLLPKEIDKVIYLDCDTLVLRDISCLWQVNLNEKFLGAIPEPITLHNDLSIMRMREFEFALTQEYFNSGVLYMNLKRIRNMDIIPLAIFYNKKFKLPYADQDILNLIFKDYLMLEPKYNSILVRGSPLGIAYLKSYVTLGRANIFSQNQVKESIDFPVILHFITSEKPWLYPGVFYLHKNTWWKYFNMSFLKTNDSMQVYALLEAEFKEFLKKGL